jgi:hypothetical protein
MKRLAIGLAVFGLAVVLAGGVWAKGVSVPKTACMHLNSWNEDFVFKFKATGSENLGGTNVKVYTISGSEIWVDPDPMKSYIVPITGTGYLLGTVLHFNWTGTGYFSGIGSWIYNASATWDLVTGDTDVFLYDLLSNGVYYQSTHDTLSPKDCAEINLP